MNTCITHAGSLQSADLEAGVASLGDGFALESEGARANDLRWLPEVPSADSGAMPLG